MRLCARGVGAARSRLAASELASASLDRSSKVADMRFSTAFVFYGASCAAAYELLLPRSVTPTVALRTPRYAVAVMMVRSQPRSKRRVSRENSRCIRAHSCGEYFA